VLGGRYALGPMAKLSHTKNTDRKVPFAGRKNPLFHPLVNQRGSRFFEKKLRGGGGYRKRLTWPGDVYSKSASLTLNKTEVGEGVENGTKGGRFGEKRLYLSTPQKNVHLQEVRCFGTEKWQHWDLNSSKKFNLRRKRGKLISSRSRRGPFWTEQSLP